MWLLITSSGSRGTRRGNWCREPRRVLTGVINVVKGLTDGTDPAAALVGVGGIAFVIIHLATFVGAGNLEYDGSRGNGVRLQVGDKATFTCIGTKSTYCDRELISDDDFGV